MNTYNDNLLSAVTGTLSTIAAEQAQQASEQTVAQYNLYYAVGAQLLAQDKLDKDDIEYDKTMDINDQGVANNNQANDLMDYAQITDQNVTAVVTNTATVAQNVQAASNAILKLAANIGSAKNLVSASDYDTDLQRMTEYANQVINKTAYQSELTSQLAMEASTIASQIISKQVLLDVTATKALFDDMGKRTQAELTSLTESRIADTKRLIAANTTQQSAEGNLKKTTQQYLASASAYEISNKDLNFDLKVAAISKDQINVSFDPLVHPFDKNGKNGTQYYLTVVKASIKDSFSFDIAEGIFNEHKDKRFLPLAPGKDIPVQLESESLEAQLQSLGEFIHSLEDESKHAVCNSINEMLENGVTPELVGDSEGFLKQMLEGIARRYPKKPDNIGEFLNELKNRIREEREHDPLDAYHGHRLHMDSDGDKIETGTSYVGFLYLVLDNNYKKEVNNFSDRMTASSNAFTLTSKLNAVDNITYQYTGAANPAENPAGPWGKLKFDIAYQANTEYRCIFLPSWSTSQDTCVGTDEAPVKIWFNLAMAEQISETNYLRAQPTSDVSNIPAGETPVVTYEVQLDGGTTNNFGHLIAENATYIPAILSIIPESKVEKGKPLADSFLPALSSLDAKPIKLLGRSETEEGGEIKALEPAAAAESEAQPSEPEIPAPVNEAAVPEPAKPEPAPAAQPAPITPEPAPSATTATAAHIPEHNAPRRDDITPPKK